MSGSRSKYCFHHAFDRIGTAPEKVADTPLVIVWAEHCLPPVCWRLPPRCLFLPPWRSESVKVAVCVGGVRYGHDSIFFPPACCRYYRCFNTDRQGCNEGHCVHL
ncbi:hypothetical protein NDU88_007645 [Pleurodeles waltl]|uniref:Uncharacterized protein n=1 Tax=Pleurodeles waltl TaxID=8319 RepID=A0AAV7QL96_PLEWA|nr:hypothetical protein NDU88_007645 [Pleurodeles waltl]